MSRIKIKIDKTGQKVKVEVLDCPGPSCQSLTEAIEKSLGSQTADELTADYYKELDQERENVNN